MTTWKKILGSQKGMSLIEILIALTLLALAGTFIAGKVFDQLAEGQIESAKIQIRNFKDTLNDFKRHCNRYPTTDQGLKALQEKPTGGKECKNYRPGGYIESIPADPWDNDYMYSSPDDGRSYVIKSWGRDGAEGGEGFDADITSENL